MVSGASGKTGKVTTVMATLHVVWKSNTMMLEMLLALMASNYDIVNTTIGTTNKKMLQSMQGQRVRETGKAGECAAKINLLLGQRFNMTQILTKCLGIRSVLTA